MQNKNSVVDFMHNFERAVKEYGHNELMSDFKLLYLEPVLTSALEGIEQRAAMIFVRNKFREVICEIEDATRLNVIERTELDNNVMLKMNRFRNPNFEVMVVIEKVQGKFFCDCRIFERIGIPCSHIFCTMKHEHIDVFPDSLTCKRWTKSAKDDYISSISSEDCDSDISCKRAGDYKVIMEAINNLCDEIQKQPDSSGKGKTNSSLIGDYVMVKTKCAPHKKKTFKNVGIQENIVALLKH